MLLQEPSETPYDLRFQFLGFPVRVSWTFWLGAVVIGYDFAQCDRIAAIRLPSPGVGPLMLLWALCVLVSILIHELGHALAFRQYGIVSSIVLYHFGGLAVPIGSLRGAIFRQSFDRKTRLMGHGRRSACAVGFGCRGHRFGQDSCVTAFPFLPLGLSELPGMSKVGKPIDSFGLFVLLTFYLYPSIFWALLNLMPVMPLDGGRIARSIVLLSGGTNNQALWLSIVAAGGLAWYAFSHGYSIMGIFFLMFAISNYQCCSSPAVGVSV